MSEELLRGLVSFAQEHGVRNYVSSDDSERFAVWGPFEDPNVIAGEIGSPMTGRTINRLDPDIENTFLNDGIRQRFAIGSESN